MRAVSIRLAVLCALALGPAVVAAAAEPAAPTVIRAGGDYRVTAIDAQADGSFLIEFKSESPTGRFDVLKLSSDHVHVAVKVGEVIRLSAEVVGERGAEAEVAQVVVFLPSASGRVPVWLLSNRSAPRELRATKYLEMHVPQNDFTVL